ncbi:MAG: cytochrome c family protein [Terricaulis sp.]
MTLAASRLALICALLFATPTTAQTAARSSQPSAGDPTHGGALYQSRCGACHSIDANRIGPLHRGVVGRRVASVAGFHYSAALAARTFVWTEANLDRWLQSPTQFVPGTAMGISVPNAQDRADIIAYLKTQAAH